MNWAFAGTVSVILHVVVLALFAWSGSEGESHATRGLESNVLESAVSETARAEKPDEQPEPKAEPKAKAEPKPKVEPKVKVESKVKPEPARADPVKPAEKTPEKVREPEREPPQVAVETYVVKKGDMLTHIAQGRNVTLQELARLNGTTVKKLSNLRVGQKIKLPKKAD